MNDKELQKFDLKDIEDEDLKCAICHYYFTKILQPYSLNCNHNLCLKCIDALIEKNMFNCPICRKTFNMEDRYNFQLNKGYLDFITKILEMKFVYCLKCQKIFKFIEHFETCDQINFKDSHESYEDINKLAKDCLKIIKSSDKHLNILNSSEISIFEEIQRIMKIININFYEFFNKTIEKFIQGIPKINQEELIEEIFDYLKSYESFIKAYNIENFTEKNKDEFGFWIENHINKLPLISTNNQETTPSKDIVNKEILNYNFMNYLNFKEIKKSPNLDFNKNKYIDSDNDSEYDYFNNNLNRNDYENSRDIANTYKSDNLNQIDNLFSKHKNQIDKNLQPKNPHKNKFKEFSSIKANKYNQEYQLHEEIINENLNNEKSPFKLDRYDDVQTIKNPMILSYKEYKLRAKNMSNFDPNYPNNNINKINNTMHKGFSQMPRKNREDSIERNEPSRYKTNINDIKLRNNANILSYSIDNILMKNFDKNQKNFVYSRKRSPKNFYTEKKNCNGIQSNDYNKRVDYIETLKSESADSSYRTRNENDFLNLNKIKDKNKNLNRRFTNFSENSNNTHVIDNYNFIDHFNNNNILNESFSSISNENLYLIKSNEITDKIQKLNLEITNEGDYKNTCQINKFDYDSLTKNKGNEYIKNNKNFSFKKSKKNLSNMHNERASLINLVNRDNVCEQFNKSDNIKKENLDLNNKKVIHKIKEKDKFNNMLNNIELKKNSLKDLKFIEKDEIGYLEQSFQKTRKTNEYLNCKIPLTNDNSIRDIKNFNNNKGNNFHQRQKIIVRNDQVKIISNEISKKNKEMRKITPSKIEIKDNKIRLVSNSPNTSCANLKNEDFYTNPENKLDIESESDKKSINNNISEGIMTIKSSYFDKYRFDNENKEKYTELNEKRRGSYNKYVDTDALFGQSKKSSGFKDSKNYEAFKLNDIEVKQDNLISFNTFSTKNINKINKMIFEKENNIQNMNVERKILLENIKEDDLNNVKQNENLYEKLFNISEYKQRENDKYTKFLRNFSSNNTQVQKLSRNHLENRNSLNKEKESISISPFKNKTETVNINKLIHTQKTFPVNYNNVIIGRDFQLSSNYDSSKEGFSKVKKINFEDINEFPEIKEKEQSFIKEKEKILFDNKKFESFREMDKPTAFNKYKSFYKLLENFNSIKDKIFRITNYSQQIELTSETLRDQISKNYSHLSDKISSNLNGLCDNIVGINSKNNYYKRIIPNIIENSKKICLFDIKFQTFDIKEFEYLTIKLNVSINIDHDGSDLIFLSGGKVSNSMNFFKGEDNFGDLSGQITAMFLILRWSTKAIELNGQLLRKRAFHSSLYFNNKLYIVGGACSETIKLKECECYNIIQKQWELLPNLNYARCNPGLCIYNQECLYVFNGWNSKNSFLDTIEFININHFATSSWSTFKPEDPGLSWEGFSNCVAAVIGENKILIFGGFKEECENKSYLFDPLKKTVFRGKDLIKESIFFNNALFFENKIYAVDNKNVNRKIFGVHVYDINCNIWKYYQGPQ